MQAASVYFLSLKQSHVNDRQRWFQTLAPDLSKTTLPMRGTHLALSINRQPEEYCTFNLAEPSYRDSCFRRSGWHLACGIEALKDNGLCWRPGTYGTCGRRAFTAYLGSDLQERTPEVQPQLSTVWHMGSGIQSVMRSSDSVPHDSSRASASG